MLVRVTIPAGAVTLHRKAFDLLEKWRWGPFLAYRAGWEKRGNGHKAPRVQDSVMIHHTGGAATGTGAARSVCRPGRGRAGRGAYCPERG